MKNLLISIFSCIVLVSTAGWEYIGSLSIDQLENINESCNNDYKYLTEILIENILLNHPHCRGAELMIENSEENSNLLNIYAICNKWGI